MVPLSSTPTGTRLLAVWLKTKDHILHETKDHLFVCIGLICCSAAFSPAHGGAIPVERGNLQEEIGPPTSGPILFPEHLFWNAPNPHQPLLQDRTLAEAF